MPLVPHTEYLNLEAATEREFCSVYLGAWDASAPGCYVSLTHCSAPAENRACTSRLDEHRLVCGERASLCGVPARCECPEIIPSLAHPAGTITLAPGHAGDVFGPENCRATPREDEAAARFEICSIDLHDCTDDACVDRREDLSLGARVSVCGVLVRCTR